MPRISKVAIQFVRFRNYIFFVMMVAAVVSAFLIPRVAVNPDMTKYLPPESSMKKGMDRMAQTLPDLDVHMRAINVMLTDTSLVAAAPAVLDSLTGNLVQESVKTKGNLTLFRYNITADTPVEELRSTISAYYGDKAVVEVDGDNLVMSDISGVLMVGFIMIFIILLVMCPSVVEVVLFLLTTGIAVLVNMGTNYFLGTVSLVTHSLVGILQMVLSMDYSVILMNRYREEKRKGKWRSYAMASAIDGSSRSILSSALTTFSGLIMLVFLNFRIGADLGIVLSKGVLISLLCNFTVLPSLIVIFDRAIEKTTKKAPKAPFDKVARIETSLRIPLTAVLVLAFGAAAYLQTKTRIGYSVSWPTTIMKEFPPDNPFLLLYSTADEERIPALIDSLQAQPEVVSALAAPSFTVARYTAAEMASRFGSLAGNLSDTGPSPVTEDLLDVVYYARLNPVRREKFSLDQLEESVRLLSEAGLLPSGLKIPEISSFTEIPAPEPVPEPVKEPLPVIQEYAVAATPAPDIPEEMPVTQADTSAITYQAAVTPLTAKQVAGLIGTDERLVSMVYSLAGKKGTDDVMEPYLLLRFVRDNVLTKKRFASMVPEDSAREIRELSYQMDSIVAAGPDTLLLAQSVIVPEVIPVAEEPAAADSTLLAEAPVTAVPAVPAPAPVVEPDPLEELAEMAFTQERASWQKTYRALRKAGVKVSRDDIRLLYLYTGSRLYGDPSATLTVSDLLDFVCDYMTEDPMYSRFMEPELVGQITSAREMLADGTGMLRGEDCSLALILTSCPVEADETFSFVGGLEALADASLPGEHYVIGESAMYKELKDGFPAELLLLTALTVIAIFLIVAFTFKSIVIPVLLILTVMTGVYINVWVSGLGGDTMLYVSYLIIQGVLMGATIDYSILFTGYYRVCRRSMGRGESLLATYRSTTNSILTSGLIITVGTWVMSKTIDDNLTASILHSLSVGATAVILLILFVMPGVIVALDRFIVERTRKSTTGDSQYK